MLPRAGSASSNLTKRERAEEAFRESEEHFRSMADSAPLMIWLTDQAGECTYLNRPWYDFTGQEPQSSLQYGWLDAVHPEDRPSVRKTLSKAHTRRASLRLEYRLRREDGEYRWVIAAVEPRFGSDGTFAGHTGSVMDITDRKEAEEQLHGTLKELADLKFALDESTIVAFTDQRGRITHVNDKFCEVSKYSRDELIGHDHRIINSSYHPREYIEGLWRTIARGKVWRGELRNRAKDGSIYWVDTTIVPFLNDRGKPYRYAAIRHEITDLKKAEEALSEIREAERGRISRELHDVVLQDLTYALQKVRDDGPAPGKADEVAAALERSVSGLRSAVSDLRQEETGGGSFVRSVQALVELNRRMSPDREVELEVEEGFPDELPARTGKELVRIVQEALANARRHSGARRVGVAVGCSHEKLWVEISDDGKGFDTAQTPAGIGTNAMHERARSFGGNLEVSSIPGLGTKVRCEVSANAQEGHEPSKENLEPVRVLLVDDHTAFRQGVAAALGREPGFTVTGQAGSLTEARQMLDCFDIAIVDLGLPDGFGGDLIRDLHATNPQAQALVLSSTQDRAEIARAVESGAAGVLHKSSEMEEVADAVKRLRAGETLMPLEEVIDLLRYAGARKEKEHEARQAISHLTGREREVLSLLAEGLEAQEIAAHLHISAKTERNHVASILFKLGVHSRLQAVIFAGRHGLVEIGRSDG